MNDADVNVCPLTPVIVAPADAFVAVVHGFERWSTPPLNVDVGEQTGARADERPRAERRRRGAG